MLQIFLVTFPFFALIALGYAAARVRALPLDAIPGLNTFVLYFALPCMLFRFGARTPIAQLLDGSVALVWGACALVVIWAVVWGTKSKRGTRIGWNDAGFGALVAAFPNTGFMGVPLLAALIGPQVAGPVIITIIFDTMVTSSVCIALSRLDGADEHGAAKAVRQAMRGMLVNPLPWSILLGALVSALHLELPAPIADTIAMLADAASPAALFTIGAVLARSVLLSRETSFQFPAALRSSLSRIGDVLPVVIVKLVAHPLLVYAVASGAMSLGLPISPMALLAIVLVAALPSASNVAMLAERFGADNGRIVRIILWTTVAAFFTFPVAVAWIR